MKFINFLKEPFFFIISIGIVFYFTYSSLSNYLNRDENVVVVTTNEIMQMEQSWESRWNRPPTSQEREGLINRHVKDIVLYRTALEMGLDKDDRVVIGRMVQKLKFMGNDLIRPPQPSEQDLVTFYEKHKEQYMPEEKVTMSHIFFDPDKREDETLVDADKALNILRSKGEFDGDFSSYGDAFMLQNYYPDRSELAIRKLFGTGFTETVFQLETDTWQGPVLSGYGTHLVYVHNHQKSELPAFNIVRDQVKNEWMEDMQKKLNDRYVEGLMARYEIVFEENESQ
jgi:peptidyl-prolyl cis-trans isomerase C